MKLITNNILEINLDTMQLLAFKLIFSVHGFIPPQIPFFSSYPTGIKKKCSFLTNGFTVLCFQVRNTRNDTENKNSTERTTKQRRMSRFVADGTAEIPANSTVRPQWKRGRGSSAITRAPKFGPRQVENKLTFIIVLKSVPTRLPLQSKFDFNVVFVIYTSYK